MIEREIEIVNRLGLHARAAAKLVQLLGGYRSAAVLAYRGREINGKSIMGVMMLAASKGTTLTVSVEGPDETEALQQIEALILDRFQETE